MIKCVKVVVVLFLFMGSIVFADDATEKKSAPHIVCGERIYDFGTMDNTLKVEHTFVIENSGGSDLVISRTKTTCGCTVAKLSSKTIAPGETADLNVVFTLRNRHGNQQKSIRVISNDPKQSDLVLYLKGIVVSELDVKPRSLFFRQSSQTNAAVKTVDIISRKPLNITNVISSSEFFLPSIETIKSNSVYKLTVALVPPIPQGHTRGSIRLKASDRDVVVNVSAICTGVLSFAPKHVVVRPPTNHPIAYYIVVRSRGKVEFEVTGVELPDDNIKYSITAFGKQGYRIRLTNVLYDKGLDGKKVVIKTNVPSMPIIAVPLEVRP